jgi:hypothetical protein
LGVLLTNLITRITFTVSAGIPGGTVRMVSGLGVGFGYSRMMGGGLVNGGGLLVVFVVLVVLGVG